MWHQVRWLTRAVPGLSAFVLAPHDAGSATRETWDGVAIRRFRYFFPAVLQRLAYPAIWPNLRRWPALALQVPFLLLAEFLATVRWTRRERFDVIYSHWFMPQGVACGIASILTQTPHVFTTHSSDVAVMRRLPFLGPWLVRMLVRRARAITAVSTRSRDIIAGFFPRAEWERLSARVAVIPMGVELREWRDLPPGSPTQLLFVGRLAEKKGVQYLLRAMTMEPLRAVDARLVIAGDGPQEGELRARVAASGLEGRVRFAGHVSGQEKHEVFACAGIVVIPSIVTDAGDAEGVPVVLLEALAAGRICVATDASGAPDIVRDGDAIIVPQKDPAALAVAIARAMRMPDNERQAMSDRARRAAAPYDWDAVARAHAQHLFAPASA
jgi:glycosyltransferase involved in cell wall biosynthesis